MTLPQDRLFIICAYVSGEQRLQEKLGRAEARHAVERCISRTERAVASQGGRVLKTEGDRLTALFESADSALQAACDIERRIDGIPPVSGIKLTVGVGFRPGDVAQDDYGVSRDAVDLAQRLAELSQGNQILTTGDSVAVLSPSIQRLIRCVEGPPTNVGDSEVMLYSVEWRNSPEAATGQSEKTQLERQARLRLRHADVDLQVDDNRGLFNFGRGATNDHVVADRRASRYHARIERRNESYVLVDMSSNGTYVKFEGEEEVVLRRQEIPLRGRGRIAFGHSGSDDDAETIEFFLGKH